MKKILPTLLLLTCFFPIVIYGQQDSQYTQYMYNSISFNPAYAGSRGVLSIMGLYRSQWLGIDGAPNTQTLTLNAPIKEKSRLGAGLSIINDEAGPFKETNFNASFSYTIPLSEKGKLSFGINAGGNLLNVDLITLRKFNENDFLLENDINNRFSPIIGLGLYYYSNKFYAGLSAPNILETKHFDEGSLSNNSNNSSVLSKERINYYLMAGYVFDITPLIKFKPAILSKYITGSPFQTDISANFMFYERLTIGAAYRISEAFSAIAGFQISPDLMIGFAYDREISQLGKSEINSGSYEVILRFELKKIYNRWLTPRFF